MAEITAALVKELREKTGVGMMDCKKALAENNGDLEASVDWLRAKGLSKAAKKADRAAAEGIVAIAMAVNEGAVVELNSKPTSWHATPTSKKRRVRSRSWRSRRATTKVCSMRRTKAKRSLRR